MDDGGEGRIQADPAQSEGVKAEGPGQSKFLEIPLDNGTIFIFFSFALLSLRVQFRPTFFLDYLLGQQERAFK